MQTPVHTLLPVHDSQAIQVCKPHHCEFAYPYRYTDLQQKVLKCRSRLSVVSTARGSQNTWGNTSKSLKN